MKLMHAHKHNVAFPLACLTSRVIWEKCENNEYQIRYKLKVKARNDLNI